ncbi:hypothetical protein DDZ16_07230 [Marinilabilia rubra]|uniref:Uncharacterized protein n=1 Tax=Marinilabilia rubra TaxID=2162893 RepID=A0A2U2BAY8_9BACT|nr:hypothetical protein DDZ16_07230 [Marinilabilia rubra]
MKKINEIDSAGIFFDASSEECRKEAKSFIKRLKSKNIQTWSVGYFDTEKPDENFISDKNLYFSTLKDFSFFFLPKSDELKEFINRKVDILFVFSDNDAFPAKAVIKMSLAHLKVGITDTFDNVMDLTFEINGNEPKKLIEQIENYLE